MYQAPPSLPPAPRRSPTQRWLAILLDCASMVLGGCLLATLWVYPEINSAFRQGVASVIVVMGLSLLIIGLGGFGLFRILFGRRPSRFGWIRGIMLGIDVLLVFIVLPLMI